ncbi:MAG TPA: hypothetical protein VFE58_11180 [Tepidisphaeraceae bacterium]|jgi:hypothetical protein|nr:hypothetical protein [Tepidisphaeraceae bacterium]
MNRTPILFGIPAATVCFDILTDTDAVIATAMKIGIKRLDEGRTEVARIKWQIGQINAQSKSLSKLMMLPDVEPIAVKALSRQMAAGKEEREQLEVRLARVGTEALEGEEKLGKAIRVAYRQVREESAATTDRTHFNRFFERYIGPMSVTAEGLAVPKT